MNFIDTLIQVAPQLLDGMKAGPNHVMIRCPFHAGGMEKTPSCAVATWKPTFFCFAGETRVLTREGPREIRDLAGSEHEVLVPGGQWVRAPFRDFGEQEIWELTLSRNGITKTIRTTERHRWFVRPRTIERSFEVVTRELKAGHKLATCYETPLSAQRGERHWQVVSVSRTEAVELVYCAVVPHASHAFALEGNILTGNCHGCHESGHVARLLRHFGVTQRTIDVILPRDDSYKKEQNPVAAKMRYGISLFRGQFVLDEAILDYYRLMPTSLKNAGFHPDTLRHFEVGFDNKNQRITYPLRSVFGELVGVSGGTIIGANPKYSIYDKELKERTDIQVPPDYTMEEAKGGLLWHGHIVRPLFFLQNDGHEEMVLTEGFKACMWTWQAGIQDVVALVGSYVTPTHAELIARATRSVTMLLDNNPAGIHGTHQGACALLRKGVDVYVAAYPDTYGEPNAREQPDDHADWEVRCMVAERMPYREWAKNHREPEDPRRLRKRWSNEN